MVPIMLGSSASQFSLLLDTIIASFLPGDGYITWLWLGDRLMEFPLGTFSVAIATVLLPALATQHARQSPAAFSATLDWGLRMTLVIGMPATLGLLLLAGPLVSTLFQHHRFTAHDVDMTAWALMAYSLAFLGFSLVKVLVPGFYARQETRLPVRYSIISFCCGMALSLTVFTCAKLFELPAAHAGLAAATSASAWINALLLLRRLRRDGAYVPQPGWRAFGLRLLVGNVALAAAVLLLAGPLEPWLTAGLRARATDVAIVVGAGAAVYFGSLWLAGLRPTHFRRSEAR